MIVLVSHDQLDIDQYWRVVDGREAVSIAPALLRHVDDRRAAMHRHLAAGARAYGVNTGLGYLADRPIPEAEQVALQRSILVGRAVGIGPRIDESTVRGTMLLRLTGFLAGQTGVSGALCRYIAERLNRGWYPEVPASRPGTAGETTPLCHLFQTFIGEGTVVIAGESVPAEIALARERTEPYALGLKEGLALINGAPLASALGADALRQSTQLLRQATTIGALSAVLMGSSWRPYSKRVADATGDAGQRAVADRLAELVAGGNPVGDAPQAPVSLRVLPQVHGAVHGVIGQLRRQVEHELRAVTDSPLYLEATDDESEGFYPTGNFHSQAMSLALDATAVAMTQVAALSEKRLHRLLDARFSGLPEQLAVDADRGGSGLVSLHKAVIGLGVENRLLASPASIHSADTSAGQEDFQAFTGLAAGKLATILDNVELILAHELVADRQASALSRREVPPALAGVLDLVAAHVPIVTSDRSLASVVEAARTLLRTVGIESRDRTAQGD